MEEFKIGEQITFLYCSDLERTAAFYEDLLGLELVLDQGSCRIVRVAEGGGGYLGYCQRSVAGEVRSGMIVTLVVAGQGQVDAWYRRLEGSGIELPESPKLNREYGIYHFFFQDPDGYQLEIQSFQSQEWDRSK